MPSGTLTVLTNDGCGNLGFSPLLQLYAGTNALTSVAVADINNDGKMDLICTSQGGLVVLKQEPLEPPVLKFTLTNSNTLVLSWKSLSPAFMLQTNSDLTGTNWGLPSFLMFLYGPNDGLNHGVAITPPPIGNVFFRLRAN